MPRVSVLLAVREGRPYFADSLASLLAQAYRDLEILVVDDASTDGSAQDTPGLDDRRVRVLRNETPLGLPASLNRALAATSASLVARMDADDIAEPGRIAAQVRWLDANPAFGVLGTAVQTIGPRGEAVAHPYSVPGDEAVVAWRLLLFSNPIAHPSVVIRRDPLEAVGGWDAAVPVGSDRDLWTRLFHLTRMTNLPDRLLRYRIHGASLGVRRNAEQRRNSFACRRRLIISCLGHDPGESITDLFAPTLSPDRAARCRDLLLRVYGALAESRRYPPDSLALVRADLMARLDALSHRAAGSRLGRLLRIAAPSSRPWTPFHPGE